VGEGIFIAGERQFPGENCHCEVYDETAKVYQVVAKLHRNSVALCGVFLSCMQFGLICI